MDDQNTSSEPVDEAEAPEPAPAPVEPDSGQIIGSDTANTPPTAPESPPDASVPIPVEDQSMPVASSTPAPQTPLAPQSQSSAQPDQSGFIRTLLAKANAKIQSKRQKKLDLLMQSVYKKGKINNRESQKLLRISDKTAERYLNKLVVQGRLKRSGAGRDVIYTLPR